MKAIDWKAKGNVVRIFFGADDDVDFHGDDWDDCDCHDPVYQEYIVGSMDVSFPFDVNVYTPFDDRWGNYRPQYCMEDLKAGVPFLVAAHDGEHYWSDYFHEVHKPENVVLKFGMTWDEVNKEVHRFLVRTE